MPATPDIYLQTLTPADIPALARLANNKKIWDNLRDMMPLPYTLEDAQTFLEILKSEKPKMTFGIYYEDAFCGVIGLVRPNDIYRMGAEIGYWLGEEFWGKGIATEAIGHITGYGFDTLGLARIHAGVMAHNVASMRVLEKNGYVLEGISKKAIYKNDQLVDEYRYARLSDSI